MPRMVGRRVLSALYLDPPVYKALQQLSERTHTPIAVYLREGVADLLAKHGVKIPKPKVR